MRTLVVATFLLTCAACGAPQPAPDAVTAERAAEAAASGPAAPPGISADAANTLPATPSASASADARASWCERYVPSVVAEASADLPPDVRPTHLMEVEFNSCTLDPQDYARQTAAEGRR